MALCGTIKHHNKNEKPCVLGFWHFLTSERIAGLSASLSAIKEVKNDFLFFVYLTTKRVVYQGKSIYLHMNIIYKQRTIKHATCVVRFGDRASYGINGRYFL